MTAEEFFLNLGKLSDVQLQAHKLCGWLREMPARDAVLGLQEVLSLAQLGHEELREILNPLMLTTALMEILPDEKRRDLFQTASFFSLPMICALFSVPKPIADEPPEAAFRAMESRGMVQTGKGDQVTLGERRALAKTPNPKTLERLIFDPDPRVIGNLLDNPHFTEKWVLKLCSRRPNRAQILRLVGCHRKWGSNLRVRKSLVMNPYTPPIVAVLSLIAAPAGFVQEVYDEDKLHPLLHGLAEYLLSQRNPGQQLI